MSQRALPASNSSDRDQLFARKSANPFFSEDDASDFGSNRQSSQSRRGGPMSSGNSVSASRFNASTDDRNEFDEVQEEGFGDVATQMQASKNRQLDSTRRALQSMYESEQIGVATADELNRQGEKLNNVEMKLDSMNSTLNQSQRHLNNIKSIFGGLTSWISKPKDSIPVKPGQPGAAAPVTSNGADPAKNAAGVGMPKSNNDYAGFFAQEASATSDHHEREINQNLSEFSSGLGRLKNLAEGLNSELDRQNAQLDRTTKKVDFVKPRIDDQNRQMNRILGQKPK